MKLTQTSGDVSMTLECDAAELALLVGIGQSSSETTHALSVQPFYFKVKHSDPIPEKDGHTLYFTSRHAPQSFYSGPVGALDGENWAWAFFLPDPPPYNQ